jgi:hypothetical protein
MRLHSTITGMTTADNNKTIILNSKLIQKRKWEEVNQERLIIKCNRCLKSKIIITTQRIMRSVQLTARSGNEDNSNTLRRISYYKR